MDGLNEEEVKILTQIADSGDHPLLMMNLNRYHPGNFPDGALYQEWRRINAEMIAKVGGKIIWTLPVRGTILTNGPHEPLDEILAYWYPSHRSFLQIRNFEITKKKL